MNGNIMELLEDSLKDFSQSDLELFKRTFAQIRSDYSDRPGIPKFFGSLWLLLENAQYSRKQRAKQLENEFLGVGETGSQWTGKADNSSLTIPGHILDMLDDEI